MCKSKIRAFFTENGFEETHKDCFEHVNVAFVLEAGQLLCCLKDSNGYKIQKRVPLRKIGCIARTNDGTAIFTGKKETL